MIIDLLFAIAGITLNFIAILFDSTTQWTFPDFFNGLVETWISATAQLNIIFPMISDPVNGSGMYASVGILDLISWFISVIIMIKFVELILWLAQMVPIFNPPKELPGANKNTLDLGEGHGSPNRLIIHKGRKTKRIQRNTRDIK